jgi:hypothetical protein
LPALEREQLKLGPSQLRVLLRVLLLVLSLELWQLDTVDMNCGNIIIRSRQLQSQVDGETSCRQAVISHMSLRSLGLYGTISNMVGKIDVVEFGSTVLDIVFHPILNGLVSGMFKMAMALILMSMRMEMKSHVNNKGKSAR